MRLNLCPPPLLILSAILVFLLLPNPARAIEIHISDPNDAIQCVYFLDFKPSVTCDDGSAQAWAIRPPCFDAPKGSFPPGIAPEQAQKIIAASAELQNLLARHPNLNPCAIWAEFYRHGGNPTPEEKALTFLGASWFYYKSEAYAQEALELLTSLEASGQAGPGLKRKLPLLLGELNRQFCHMQEAREIFEKLAQNPEYMEDEIYSVVVSSQLELVKRKNGAYRTLIKVWDSYTFKMDHHLHKNQCYDYGTPAAP